MGVSGQRHPRPCFIPGKGGGLKAEDRRQPSASVGNRNPIVQLVVSHYTDWATRYRNSIRCVLNKMWGGCRLHLTSQARPSSGLFKHGFHESRRISWQAERPSSFQERLHSMKLIRKGRLSYLYERISDDISGKQNTTGSKNKQTVQEGLTTEIIS